MLRSMFVFAMVISAATTAAAGLELWSGNPANVTITDNDAQIDAAGTFKFQSVTGGSLDVIGIITVADGVSGTVIVYIERDTDDNSPGATNVGAINLTNDQGANLTGNLAELRITGNLATEGDVTCDNITGNVDVGGSVDISGAPATSVTVGDISGDIQIDGDLRASWTAEDVTGTIAIDGDLLGGVSVNTLANFTAGDATSNALHGNVTIAQGYSATMIMNDTYYGQITVGGEMSGRIDINGNMVGASITVGT